MYFQKPGTSGGLNNRESVSLKHIKDDIYEGSFEITKYTLEGKWKLEYVNLTDVAGNIKSYKPKDKGYEFLDEVNFTVSGTTNDTKAPTMASLEIDKQEVELGDTFTLRASITDDISGVKSAYVYFQKPGTSGGLNNRESVSLKHIKDDIYEGSFEITKYTLEGKWKLEYVNLTDVAGNIKSYKPKDKGYEFLDEVNFTVSGTTNDTKAPTMASLEIDKQEVELGDTFTLRGARIKIGEVKHRVS